MLVRVGQEVTLSSIYAEGADSGILERGSMCEEVLPTPTTEALPSACLQEASCSLFVQRPPVQSLAAG
ncbi:MAG: hypothetical protein AAF892_02030 [Cyanobacteria bacterium P01_D01_bin.71]